MSADQRVTQQALYWYLFLNIHASKTRPILFMQGCNHRRWCAIARSYLVRSTNTTTLRAL